MPNPKDKTAAGSTPKTQTSVEKPPFVSMPNTQASVPSSSSANSARERTTAEDEARAAEQRTPTYEEIAVAAYQLYLDRGAVDGFADEDWLQAERELMDGQSAQRKERTRAKGA